MTKRLKKISEEIIHKNPRWEYKHDLFELPDGTRGEYFYGEKFGAVIIVPILDDRRIVLVSQYRYLHDKFSIEFPKGSLEEGEAAQQGATRELEEETGYQSTNYIKVGSCESSPSIFKSAMHIFIADELGKQKEQNLDKEEVGMQILYRRIDEFEDMIKRGEIWDGQTLAAWAMARDRVLQKLRQ